jgi:hypothetical protein
MFVSAAVVLRRVRDEDCADIIILPRGKCCWTKVNDFELDVVPPSKCPLWVDFVAKVGDY